MAMPLLNDPVAWVSETAASLAEISSRAWNSLATWYLRPRTRPASLGSWSAANRVVFTMALGFSAGISVMAVSILSVLAGANWPCGSLAASTCPVLASAMTYAEAGILGSFQCRPEDG